MIFRLGRHLPMNRIRIIKHEAVPKCGSYEVKFPDGRPSKFFYWEDTPGHRLSADQADKQAGPRGGQGFRAGPKRSRRLRAKRSMPQAV